MIRTFKWVYELGIRHERIRIAAHLQVQAQSARTSSNIMDDMLRDQHSKTRPKKRAVERLEFDMAVNHRVEAIINDMFDSKGDWIPSASIMFPDDNLSNNKEIK